MKIRVLVVMLFFLFCVNMILGADMDIRLNSLGFSPGMPKKASIIAECSNFTVKEASNNEAVFSGKVTGPVHQDDVDQDVWIADFSEVKTEGKFYLDVPGVGRSYDFEIMISPFIQL
jgi:endoglucanase